MSTVFVDVSNLIRGAPGYVHNTSVEVPSTKEISGLVRDIWRQQYLNINDDGGLAVVYRISWEGGSVVSVSINTNSRAHDSYCKLSTTTDGIIDVCFCFSRHDVG